MTTRVVITQPDFWPWLGFFDKVRQADVFVFLDHVTNRPNDGIWTKRVRVFGAGEPRWIGVPLRRDREREFVPICDMQIADSNDVARRHKESLRHWYSRHPFFAEAFPHVAEYYNDPAETIADRNINAIVGLMKHLGRPFVYLRSSTIGLHSKSNELLIEIVRHVGGSHYVFGEGSRAYLDEGLWKRAGIELVPQAFDHPQYPQLGAPAFVPGLSVIDVLMNVGFDGLHRLVFAPDR
jgi:hypothetical protein